MGDHRRRGSTQSKVLVRMGPQHMRPSPDAVALGDLEPTLRDRGKGTAAVGRCTHVPERPRAWHHQRGPGITPAEPEVGDAELIPAGDEAVVYLLLAMLHS